MSDHEWFLFVMLLVLIATFLLVYFNPLENPLKEKKVETNDFPAADQYANDFWIIRDRCYENVLLSYPL